MLTIGTHLLLALCFIVIMKDALTVDDYVQDYRDAFSEHQLIISFSAKMLVDYITV